MSDAINRGRLSFDIQLNDKIYEQQPGRQVGDDNYHVDLYGEIVAELRANAPETLTDSNTIFIDGINGNDSTGDGSESTPYKTVAKGVEVFFAQGTRTLKYFCLKGYSYFCEDVQIPKWLEDYIYCESSTATAIGNVDMSGGHDWSAGNEDFIIYTTVVPGGATITLDANCANQAAVISHINTKLTGAGISDVEAYDAGSNYVGIKKNVEGDYSFRFSSINAHLTLGIILGIYIGKERIKIRRVQNSLPGTINNTNTKFVSFDTSTSYNGTIELPYADIGSALNSITTTSFTNVAVKVNGCSDECFGVSTDYQNAYSLPGNIWTPTSAVTQTVNIFPYYSNTGHDFNPGFSLYIGGSFNNSYLQTSAYYPAKFQNFKKYQYIISRNFHAADQKEVIFCGYNTNTYCIEKTSDFKTISTIASTSTKNWCGICEYYYNGYWYLLVCADDGGSAMRIFHYRSDGSDTGEITVSLDNTASTTKRHYFLSDGNNAFMVCYDSSKSYIFLAKDNVDITVNSNWINIYEGTNDIRLFKTPDNEFYWIEDGKTNIYKYNGDESYNIYDFGIEIKLLFKYNNIYYGIGKNELSTTKYICKLYFLNFETNNINYTGNNYIIGPSIDEMRIIIYFNRYVYFTTVKGQIYQFTEDLDRGRLDITGPEGHTISNDGLSSYQIDTLNGLMFGLGNQYLVDERCISQLMVFGDVNISGFIFLPNIDDIAAAVVKPQVTSSISGNSVSVKYSSFNSIPHPILNKESMIDNISNCAFIDCDYPIVIEGYADYAIENCVFSNYITGVHYQCLSDADDEPLTINNCTGYNGTTFFEEDAREVNTDEQSSVNDCIIAKTSVSIKSYADTAVDATNSILYPYSTSLNATFDDDCINAIPLFQDPEDNDFRLKTISAGYQYNSAGYQESDTTDTATGKDYSWSSYSAQNIDIGAMVVLDPVFRGEQWETITLDYSPQSFQLDYIQDDTSLNRTLQNKAYKVSPKIYRQFTYSFRSDNSFNLDNIQKIRRLMEQTDKFKLFMNPLLDYDPSECADGTVGWRSGNWTITDMVIATGLTMETGMYNNLFVRIHDSGDIYEYRISDTDSSGNLTLEDYWEIGDMTNGTYNTEISYALVLYDTSNLQNKNQVYGGINYNDSVPLAGQTLKFIEAI